jgi:hypothetical protein
VPWWKKWLQDRNSSNVSNDKEVNMMNFKCDIAKLK